MLKFNVITLFPEAIENYLNLLPFKRAKELGKAEFNILDLRKFAVDKRGSVDDKPYGGGVGMIIRIEPVYNALESLEDKGKVVLLTPAGNKFSQEKAVAYSKETVITLISGRYEGIDARVEELVDEKLSMGDYILAGGELPALTTMEAVTRLLPNVLEKEATEIESFMDNYIEYPQYTRPEEFKGMKVPDALLSGDHKRIKEWRESKKITI